MMKTFLKAGLIAVVLSLALQANVMGQFFFMMENPLVGKKAPDFSLALASGEKGSLKQMRGDNGVILFFWATWCPSCNQEIRDLDQVREKLEDNGIRVLLVDLEEPAKAVSKYLKKYKIDIPCFLDEKAEVADAYGLIGVPTYYFINKEGIVEAVEHSLPEQINEILDIKS